MKCNIVMGVCSSFSGVLTPPKRNREALNHHLANQASNVALAECAKPVEVRRVGRPSAMRSNAPPEEIITVTVTIALTIITRHCLPIIILYFCQICIYISKAAKIFKPSVILKVITRS